MFRELLHRCGQLTDDQADQLEAHYELLCRWPEESAHLSLLRINCSLRRKFRRFLGLLAADVVTGAGFPGIPLLYAGTPR